MGSYNGPVIDSHLHLFKGLDDIEGLDLLQRRVGANAFCLASLPICDLPYSTQATHFAAFLRKRLNPERTYVFAALDYQAPGAKGGLVDFARQAKEQIEAGADGIKMLEGKPNVRRYIGRSLSDKVYDSLYSYLEQARLPLLLHVADPAENWDPKHESKFAKESGWCWYWGGGGYESKEGLYSETEEVLSRFPRMKVALAHFFFLSGDIERADRFLNRWPQVSFDITPGIEMYHDFTKSPGEWREFFVRHSSRIIFGTDNCGAVEQLDGGASKFAMMRSFLETDKPLFNGHGLALDNDTLFKIYAGNFMAFAGKSPRHVDCGRLLELCHAKMGRLPENSPIRQELMKMYSLFAPGD